MRTRLVELQARCQRRLGYLEPVTVLVAESPGPCPVCGGFMKVQKTAPRCGRTLAHGSFDGRETVHVCAARCCWPSGALVARRAAGLRETLMPGRNVGYDVMVFVGEQRFLHRRQREEIQTDLLKAGVSISTGEVSALARCFAHYFARLHRARSGLLKAALEADGGWPLHVDATGEAGRGTLLVVMAGWRKWVLGAWKISTERTDLVLPLLRGTVRRFGDPCAAMRDMGKAMIPALDDLVAELKHPIPVLVCHQHFVADVGSDLLKHAHTQLRDLFRRTKVRPKLRALVRDIGRRIGEDIEEARKAVCRWQSLAGAGHCIDSGRDGLAVVRALAQWALDYKADATGLDFPFDRPYLDLNNRCRKMLRAADAFLRNPPEDKEVVAALKRLHRYLEPVDSEVPFRQIVKRLRCRAALLDELRKVLRLTASLPENETTHDIEQMHEQLDQWTASLLQRRPLRGPTQDTRDAVDIILKHIATHGSSLWGHAIQLPKHAGGAIRLVHRTNFLPENFFGDLKHNERRRSGHKNLGQDLEHLPAEAALVKNLEDDDYVTIVCGSRNQLASAFVELDRVAREKKLNLMQPEDQEEDTEAVLQIASASLSPADRRVVRTQDMDRRIAAAAGSRAPRCRC